jgi:L-rhamnose mutarotase
MERICYTFELAPGEEAEYERRHHEMWPEMHAALHAAGFRSHSLFRRGLEVIAYAECEPTAAETWAKLEKTEVNPRWTAYIRALMTRAVDSDGNLFIFDEIWHLE